MTCIVGVVNKKEGTVTIGADSAGSDSWGNLTIREDRKIFFIGEFLLGCTTSYRMIQLLQYTLELPKVDSIISHYMCTKFMDAVRNCLKAGGYLSKEKEVEEIGTFLVGYKDRLFKVESDLSVGESRDGIMACGSGGAFALASLNTSIYINSDYPGDEMVMTALHISEKLCTSVSKPFIIHTTIK